MALSVLAYNLTRARTLDVVPVTEGNTDGTFGRLL